MLFEIKSRFSGSILFSLETENLRICVEAAIKAGADLRGADLGGADLGGAYLRGTDLVGANLRDADLRDADLRAASLVGANLSGADLRDAYLVGAYLVGAKIRDNITVTQAPICIQGLEWPITIWDHHMQIGCEFHSHDEWRNFDDSEWARMGGKEAIRLRKGFMGALDPMMASHAQKAQNLEAKP